MAINGGEVVAYGIMIERLQRQAGQQARRAVAAWLRAHTPWEAAELRAATALAVSQAVTEFGDAVASLACDMYDSCMVAEGVRAPSAEPWTGDSSKQIAKAVRYQLSKALDGDEGAFLDAVQSMTEYYTRLVANNTTMQNVERDNMYTVEGGASTRQMNEARGNLDMPTSRTPKNRRYGRARSTSERRAGDVAFARVPTGMETCTYCMMLASRGFVYRSRESAGHADHRGCNCMIVAGRYMESTVDGIDLKAQYDCWRDLEALEAYAAQNPDEFGGTDAERKAELERRKAEIVDGYDDVTLPTEPGEVRKMASRGVRAWYEPRGRMAANYRG